MKKLFAVKKMSGSYTVEAAFVVPVIFGILFSLLYLLFWLHDRCILYHNLREEILYTIEYGEEQEEAKRKDRLQKNLWMFEVCEEAFESDLIYMKGEVRAEANWFIPVMDRFMNGKQKIVLEEKQIHIKPSEILWFGEKIEDWRGK